MSKERLNQLRRRLSEWEVDGLLITSDKNYRWLSGFTGSNCTLLVTADRALLGTDFRYWEQAQQQAPDFELVKMGSSDDLASFDDLVAESGAARIGIEAEYVTLATFADWRGKCADPIEQGDLEFVPLEETLEGLRLIKTADEVALIRKAANITDAAMSKVPELARPGLTEKELAWQLERMMRDMGAEGTAFDIIVASGPNAALAHHRPGDRKLQEGDAIVIDMGARVDGYHSDLTRTFYLGDRPSDKFTEIYDLVHTAQKNALAKMRPGMTGKEIDALARDIIDEAGHGEHFGHSLGHGLGLYIHEDPRLASSNSDEIPAETVITVEPGVYLPEWGGVRIEDLVLLTADGPEFLSHCPKEPIIPTRDTIEQTDG